MEDGGTGLRGLRDSWSRRGVFLDMAHRIFPGAVRNRDSYLSSQIRWTLVKRLLDMSCARVIAASVATCLIFTLIGCETGDLDSGVDDTVGKPGNGTGEPDDSGVPTKQTELAATTSENCFVALFVGSQCGEEGGVYQIDTSWVSNHPGGSLKGACGTVVTDWGNTGGGSHSTHVDNLKAQKDLGSSATYKGPLDCSA